MTPIEKLRRIADYTALNNVAEAIREVADELERGPWQPIETAPKDGRSVLVAPGIWCQRSCSVARFNKDEYARKPRPYWERDDDLGKVTYSRANPPTHWMPIPPAPAATEGAE